MTSSERSVLAAADFISSFEECTLPGDSFHHRDHIRLAWLFLREQPLIEALNRFTVGLERFATSLGQPQLYHQTITWAYFFLIHQRMHGKETTTFEEFVAANADLFEWNPSVLDRYYTREALDSKLARSIFILPDRSAMSIVNWRECDVPRHK